MWRRYCKRDFMIPAELIPSFLFYAFVSGITPGPANLSSLSMALRHGRRDAIHQWYRLFVGYATVALLSVFVCYFIGTVFEQHVKTLSLIGVFYIVWLSFKLFKEAFFPQHSETDGKVKGTFITGLLIQLTNVKIMVFCVTAISIYVLPYNADLSSLLLCGLLLPFTGPVCNLAWLFAGVVLKRFFGKYHKTINILMGLLLLFCAASILDIL